MVANLAPRKMKFGMSEGMVLAASDAAGNTHASVGRLTSQRDRTPCQLGPLAPQVGLARAEGVGAEHLGAQAQVIPMNRAHQVRRVHQGLRAPAPAGGIDAAGRELGAHGSVQENQRATAPRFSRFSPAQLLPPPIRPS